MKKIETKHSLRLTDEFNLYLLDIISEYYKTIKNTNLLSINLSNNTIKLRLGKSTSERLILFNVDLSKFTIGKENINFEVNFTGTKFREEKKTENHVKKTTSNTPTNKKETKPNKKEKKPNKKETKSNKKQSIDKKKHINEKKNVDKKHLKTNTNKETNKAIDDISKTDKLVVNSKPKSIKVSKEKTLRNFKKEIRMPDLPTRDEYIFRELDLDLFRKKILKYIKKNKIEDVNMKVLALSIYNNRARISKKFNKIVDLIINYNLENNKPKPNKEILDTLKIKLTEWKEIGLFNFKK